jgi:hypothetical protein
LVGLGGSRRSDLSMEAVIVIVNVGEILCYVLLVRLPSKTIKLF